MHSAHVAEALPIAKVPDGIACKRGREKVHAGKGSFYRFLGGDSLIAMNTAREHLFKIPSPARGGILIRQGSSTRVCGRVGVSPMVFQPGRRVRIKHALILSLLFPILGVLADSPGLLPLALIQPKLDSERAPHGRGNVYAPEVLRSKAGLRMWFGAQGRDGHDRIHLAESVDGIEWQQRGVVLEDPTANHCNDPSVVEVDGMLLMFYTRAGSGVTDEIAVATSKDGIQWETRGVALKAGEPGSWDSFCVGRPSVLWEDGTFWMWYDGRKDLPPDAPDPKVPKSNVSQRHVGLATSRDGLNWQRHGSEPLYDHDTGGIHVVRIGEHLVMLSESRKGTEYATSRNGINWRKGGLLVERFASPAERYGHVTPFLLPDMDGSGATLYYGATAESAWNANTLSARRLSAGQWLVIKHP